MQDLRGVVADDPMRAMQALPGVATGDDFQAQFSVRGSAFRHVGIVTDGITTPLLLHQVRGANDTGSIAMINTDVIQRASLQSGPHPLRHGDWIGATMEFDLREGSRDRAMVRAAVSGTSASTVLEGPIGSTKRGSWLVSVRKSYIDWLIRKLEPEVDSTIGFTDFQGKAVYDLTSCQQLQILFLGGRANYQEVDTSAANGLQDATSRSAVSSVGWRYARPSFVVTQRLSLLTSDFDNRGERGQQLGRGTEQSIVWRGDVVRPLSSQWTLEGGALTESQHASQMLREFRLQNSTLRVDSEQNIGGPNGIASGWAQLARRTSQSGVAGGVRTTRASMGPWTAISPWLLAERTLGSVTVRSSVGAASQFPDIVLAKANRPPAPIAPEHAVSTDLGLEHHLTKTTRWLVTGFRREDSNVVRRIGEDQLVGAGGWGVADRQPVFGAELDGTARGVDVVLERRAPAGLSGWVGYTWAHTRYHDTLTGERFDGDFDQRHTLNVVAQQRLSYRFGVSAKLRVGSNFPLVGYFSGTPDNLLLARERNQVRLPVYVRLDLRANYAFTFNQHRLTLFIEVMNATGRENLGQADGFIRGSGQSFLALGYGERLIPRVPSAGFLIEF